MTNLKYSEYVRAIADKITAKDKYICNEIMYNPLSREYPEYRYKLRKTIKTKIAKLAKRTYGIHSATLFFAWLRSGMKVDEITWRKQWLETIARIHERKGN